MDLPDKPTIYDYLLLSLRGNDVIATFNWDPFIIQAYRRINRIRVKPKVTGVGCIFFYADNPKETKEWYTKNLGIEINDWGSSSFESRSMDNPDKVNSLQWKPFKTGDEYFPPSKKIL